MSKEIVVKDLTKRYKKAKEVAVDKVSINVEKGEFFAFLGPNGAGKTTTISILTTILQKTSGEVKISGYDIDRDSAMVRSKIGVIFQNPSLDLNLTAEENIRFHAVLYGIYSFSLTYAGMPKSYRDKVNELSELIGIKDKLFAPVKTFSGGMKRKLEIIRSLIHDPEVLFLDEPTSGLDPASRRNLWDYINEVRRTKNTTVFLTTHYLEEAEGTDRVAIINHGKIVKYGSPSKIKKEMTSRYLVIGAGDNDSISDELTKIKINYETADGLIRIPIVKTSEIQNIIQNLKTNLNHIEIVSPTLEEAYLSIINNGKNS